MNTLPRAVTAQFFPSIDSYNALRRHWSDLMNSERRHGLTAEQHLLYLALLGRDWRQAFTAPTNPRKLENGAFLGWELFRALRKIHSPWAEAELLAPFAALVTPDMLAALRTRLPSWNPYALNAADFAAGSIPFEAYYPPEQSALPTTAGDTHA